MQNYRGRVAPGASALSFSAQKSFTENPDFLDEGAFFFAGFAAAFASFFGAFFSSLSLVASEEPEANDAVIS